MQVWKLALPECLSQVLNLLQPELMLAHDHSAVPQDAAVPQAAAAPARFLISSEPAFSSAQQLVAISCAGPSSIISISRAGGTLLAWRPDVNSLGMPCTTKSYFLTEPTHCVEALSELLNHCVLLVGHHGNKLVQPSIDEEES